MSDDRDHIVAAVAVASEEEPYGVRIDMDRLITVHGVDEDQRAELAGVAERTPVTRAVRAGTEIRTVTGAA